MRELAAALLAALLFSGTMPSTGAGQVEVSAGADIQRYVDAAPAGTTFLLAAGVFTLTAPIVPRSRDTFLGAGEGVTTLDGVSASFNGIDARGGVANVTVSGLTVRRSVDGIRLGPGWVVRDVEATQDVIGLQFGGFAGATIEGAHVHHNGRFGIHGSGDDTQVLDSDISFNHTDRSWGAGFSGGLKWVASSGCRAQGNSIHDNFGNALWFDEDDAHCVASGNMLWGNQMDSIRVEISSGTQVLGNTVAGSIDVLNSRRTLVRDNVVVAPSTVASPLLFAGNGRTSGGVEYTNTDNSAIRNTITLLTGQRIGVIRTAGTTANDTFAANAYTAPSLTEPYFKWWDGTAIHGCDWTTWRATYGQDATGTMNPAA